LTFFASGFRPLPNFCRISISTNVPFLMKDLSVARSKVYIHSRTPRLKKIQRRLYCTQYNESVKSFTYL
jgi:hypothetical protein